MQSFSSCSLPLWITSNFSCHFQHVQTQSNSFFFKEIHASLSAPGNLKQKHWRKKGDNMAGLGKPFPDIKWAKM